MNFKEIDALLFKSKLSGKPPLIVHKHQKADPPTMLHRVVMRKGKDLIVAPYKNGELNNHIFRLRYEVLNDYEVYYETEQTLENYLV